MHEMLFNRMAAALLISFILIVPPSLQATDNGIKASVVKIYAEISRPDYIQPWQSVRDSSTGSGAVISGNRILTVAHVVADATFIMVRKQGDPRKYPAKLVAAGHQCDLAVLKVDDEDFFKDTQALEIGELPFLQDEIAVLGYPMGGDNISITEGVVSRIEYIYYTHSGRFLLSVQLDAAINPGNSGGPAVKDGKLAGIAFEVVREGQSIGYTIPPPVIKHFLADIADGKFDGFPAFGFNFTPMENPAIRKWAKMKDGQSGILITKVIPTEKKSDTFKLNDVLMAVDGVQVADDGSVPFRDGERIFVSYLILDKNTGDTCKVKILREGKELDLDYQLSSVNRLVPTRNYDVRPSYFIAGGLLFMPLSWNLLDSWGDWNKAPDELVNLAKNGEITEDRDQVVIISEVLADDVNMGYQEMVFSPVTAVNSQKVRNLKDLVAKIEAVNTGFIEIDLENRDKIVLDAEKAKKAMPGIIERYRIPADRSQDLGGNGK